MSRTAVAIQNYVDKTAHGDAMHRLEAELKFALQVSERCDNRFDGIIEEAARRALELAKADGGVVTPDTVKAVESLLAPVGPEAKAYKIIAPAHAHLDMNWMWRYDETVAITLSTFETMLRIMDEYPDVCFSQSQASVYEIVEKYGTEEMLEKIRRYVCEGRWEVTASTWVEGDKNMPSGEAMARHQLYTKKYLSGLLDIPEESLDVDFEPDTFGHSANVPEILAKGGVKYYYHSRGSQLAPISRWRSASGAEVIIYEDLSDTSYNYYYLDHNFADYVMHACPGRIRTSMRLYGMGDHGGGPSRKDIEKLIDMMNWPIFPTIKFGTMREYFHEIEEKYYDELPVITGPLNYVFTGCYTSQSRIKAANRIAEAALHDSELFAAAAHTRLGTKYHTERYRTVWQNTLFSHFHDILPGSGKTDTTEYARGKFQETMACASTEQNSALRSLIRAIDTSRYMDPDDKEDLDSSNAGRGFMLDRFTYSIENQGYGAKRMFHIFNPSQQKRKEICELYVWEWGDNDPSLMEFRDADGNPVPHIVTTPAAQSYWGNKYYQVLLPVELPGYGYTTISLAPSEDRIQTFYEPGHVIGQRTDDVFRFVLENERVRIELDRSDASIVSYYDKEAKRELIDGKRACLFKIVEEGTEQGMTAWRDGRRKSESKFGSVRIDPVDFGVGTLRQAVVVRFDWKNSHFTATLSLDKGSDTLKIDLNADWHEIGCENHIPQLIFSLPLGYEAVRSLRDIPGGAEYEEPMDRDIPALTYMAALDRDGAGLMLTTDTKYGYRLYNGQLDVDLVRSSFNPDPYPEYGEHPIRIAVCPVRNARPDELKLTAFDIWHPMMALSAMPHKGTLPMSGTLYEAEGAFVEGVKLSEDGRAVVVRLCNQTAETRQARFAMPGLRAAALATSYEKEVSALTVENGGVRVTLAPEETVTLRLYV